MFGSVLQVLCSLSICVSCVFCVTALLVEMGESEDGGRQQTLKKSWSTSLEFEPLDQFLGKF